VLEGDVLVFEVVGLVFDAVRKVVLDLDVDVELELEEEILPLDSSDMFN